jgi:hypothetical protein
MAAQARMAVAISFIAVSLAGGAIVFFHWHSDGAAVAVWLTALFVIISASIHLAGYLLYVQQDHPQQIAPLAMSLELSVSPLYWPALRFGILVQGIVGLLTALMLDGGRSFSVFTIALFGHWLGMILIVSRRPLAPTKMDIIFIRWGTPLLMLVVGAIAPQVWKVIGESDLNCWQRLRDHLRHL